MDTPEIVKQYARDRISKQLWVLWSRSPGDTMAKVLAEVSSNDFHRLVELGATERFSASFDCNQIRHYVGQPFALIRGIRVF